MYLQGTHLSRNSFHISIHYVNNNKLPWSLKLSAEKSGSPNAYEILTQQML